MGKKRPTRPVRRIEEEEDYDDDYEEEYDDEDEDDEPPPRRRRPPVGTGRPGVLAWILAVVGVIALSVLAFSPSLPWFGVSCEVKEGEKVVRSASVAVDGWGYRKVAKDPPKVKEPAFAYDRPERLPADARPEGTAIRTVSIVCAVILVIVFSLGSVLPIPAGGRRGIWGWGSAVVLALTVMLIIWQLAWLGKIAWTVRENPTIKVDWEWADANPRLLPSFGLFLGVGTAILAAIVISAAANRALRGLWIRLFELAGVLLGLAVGCLVVRPWDVNPLIKALLG